MKVLRVNRLRSSILSGDVSQVGKFHTVERMVNLNADDKRMWFEELSDVNNRMRINSLPISLNFSQN